MNVFILETVNFIKSRKLLPTNINKTTGNKTWLKLGTSPQKNKQSPFHHLPPSQDKTPYRGRRGVFNTCVHKWNNISVILMDHNHHLADTEMKI